MSFGWALTQNPFIVPTDGSTITVFVDGTPTGHPTYNQFRSDIAMLFAGYVNSNGAVGFFFIDTTKLQNKIPTICWSVTDNGGRVDGIGSRYSTVFNAGGGGLAATRSRRIISAAFFRFSGARSPLQPWTSRIHWIWTWTKGSKFFSAQ